MRFQSTRFRNGLGLCLCLGLALPAYTAALALPEAQACGGNSTVDILGAEAAASARAFLAKLQSAVQSGDKTALSGMVSYPLLVIRSGARTRIRSRAAFLAQYDRLFTPAIRKAILAQKSQCLFGNSSGAMIGDGELWFREESPGGWKIITINQSTP
jgi:hypothetical protein